MEDFDLDLIDELCSSFCTPCTSQKSNEKTFKTNNESSVKSNRKRTSTMNSPQNPVVKKVRLSDMTNTSTIYECDEDNILDESAIQLLVRTMYRWCISNFQSIFSAKNGKRPHNFHHYWTEWLLY